MCRGMRWLSIFTYLACIFSMSEAVHLSFTRGAERRPSAAPDMAVGPSPNAMMVVDSRRGVQPFSCASIIALELLGLIKKKL